MTELEKECRKVCEEKGYDPDYPTCEGRKQWESFYEIARVRMAERARRMIATALAKDKIAETRGRA